MIKNKNWISCKLIDLFPSIQRGKRLRNDDHIAGKMPYVSSTGGNNGIDNYIGNSSKIRIFSNCLTLANSGSVGSTFFHPYKFVASDHVTRLENENFNLYSYLFIAALVKRMSEKYGFNREVNDKRIKKEKILLPVNLQNEPYYELMESYIKTLKAQKERAYFEYISKRFESLKGLSKPLNLEEKEWQEFYLGDLFTFFSGKSKGLNHLIKAEKNGVNYLGATNQNNGVLAYVIDDPKIRQKGNCICFIRNGEGSMGYSIYKKEDFIATSDISVGYSKFLNSYIGFFITTVADKIRGKYNFGYKRSETRLKKEKIMLPINAQGQPDYEYMEQYMKYLEYQKIKNYLDFKSKKTL